MRGCLVVFALLFATSAGAQTPRPGMRLTVTRVAPTGGFTASAFLVVHATTVTRTAAPECGAGAIRFEAEGHDERGRVRVAHLVAVAAAAERSVEIGAARCGASLELTLDDGAHLVPSHGALRAHLAGANGLDATLDASATDAAGVPTTVTGHIVLAPQ